MDETDNATFGEQAEGHVTYNLGDLKKEEEILISLYSKMKDQLHKLEVEELELKQRIRKKELQDATEQLFAPPPVAGPSSDGDSTLNKSSKGKSSKSRKRDLTGLQDDVSRELDDSLSTASTKTVATPTRKSPRKVNSSPSKLKSAKNLTIPSFESETLSTELDLSALNSFSVPTQFHATSEVESEDD